MMDVHKPFLKWNVRTYQLEGSLAHDKVPEDVVPSRVNWEYSESGTRSGIPTHRPPENSLVYRKRKLERSNP